MCLCVHSLNSHIAPCHVARESYCSEFIEVNTEALRGKLTCPDNEHVRDRASVKVQFVSLLGILVWTEFCPLK